jgi:hypothetical protein
MKRYFKYNIVIALAFLAVSIVSCNTAEQDASPIVSPDDYPVATFTTDFTGSTINEGDTIMYTITLDKAIDWDLNFDFILNSGTLDNDLDAMSATATIAPYETETEIMIIFVADNFPEVSETAQIEIKLTDLAETYLVNPTTVFPVLDLTVVNVNDPDLLTVAFGWTTEDDDIDLFAIHETNGDWGLAGSSDNPEIMLDIAKTDDDGAYYITIDPYHVEGSTFDYTISIGHPDQTVEFFNGTFDMNALDTYTVDYFAFWDVNSYRLATATNNSGVFTVVHLNE